MTNEEEIRRLKQRISELELTMAVLVDTMNSVIAIEELTGIQLRRIIAGRLPDKGERGYL